MPLYEYECIKCKHRFEERRSVTDPPASRCPECRGRVRRVYRPVGIIFRGSGFHITDYGRTGEKKKAEQPASTGEKKKAEQPASTEGAKED